MLRAFLERLKSYESIQKRSKSHKSAQDYLNQNLHSHNTLFNHLFWLKRVLWE